jgi:hypothetical protein
LKTANLQTVTARFCCALTLIIDDDLGFLMWLGEVFKELGCQAIPALHCRQALDLVKRFNLPIANLIVNPELRGAERTVKAVLASNPRVRVVLICNSAAQTRGQTFVPNGRGAGPRGIPARSRLKRPSPEEAVSLAEWVEKVRKMLDPGPRNYP